MTNGSISQFVRYHFRHFNAAALVDAADGYRAHLAKGGKMMITLAGAMSTAELGLSLAEMIRQEKVHA
ncbi:MAG: deoxyhypusine synthase, partial [Chloroflexus sp.]|nr:deoxyhypusine synthase [Chloroflexus sp.]